MTRSGKDGMPEYGNKIQIEVDDFEYKWIGHPDENVDLAIFPIGDILNNSSKKNEELFYIPMSKVVIPIQEMIDQLTAIEDVIMIGYPNGLLDSTNNLPIVRRGITATPFAIDHEGKKEFVIDSACFPGSSGSPIFLLNQGSYPTKGGGISIGNRVALLGVLYAGPQQQITGEIITVNVPTDRSQISALRIPINLGYCIKSDRILEFESIMRKCGFFIP